MNYLQASALSEFVQATIMADVPLEESLPPVGEGIFDPIYEYQKEAETPTEEPPTNVVPFPQTTEDTVTVYTKYLNQLEDTARQAQGVINSLIQQSYGIKQENNQLKQELQTLQSMLGQQLSE